MAKASRPVKTITINKSRDIIVDRLLKQCEDENHSKCTGWAVLKKEISPIDANYLLKCTCACHHHKKVQSQASRKKKPKKSIAPSKKAKRKAKKKLKRQQKKRPVKKSKKKNRKNRKR